MTAQGSDVLDAALAFHDAGVCVIRASANGTKAPLGQWKPWQSSRPDRRTVEEWFADGHPGVGVVTGAVSGNLEMLELEGRAVADGVLAELSTHAEACGLGDLWRRVCGGYSEGTPSGGLHFLYRVDGDVPGNTKLASRPGPDGGVEVLVETRGQGGFVVTAPSHGPVHPTGRAWRLGDGSPAAIPTITVEEHQALHALCRLADRMPPPEPGTFASDTFADPYNGVRPGDDYNQRTDWADILIPAGWALSYSDGDRRYWRRPGKTGLGISATTGYGDRGDWLYVFTTSTELEAERAHTKFAVYAVLNHGGDHRAAARALSAAGYGVQRAEIAVSPVPDGTGDNASTRRIRDRLLSRSQLANLPQPEPLIANTLDKRSIVVTSGRRSKGKSFVVLDWACCIATGKNWQGRTVDQAPVLWLAAEGAYGMHRRIEAWEHAWSRSVEINVLPLPVNLYTGKHFDELVEIVRDLHAGYVVFDTWARCTVGGSENDNSDATVACDRLEALRELGATSNVIAHTDSDDTKTRGATALEDNVDIVYRLKGEPDHLILSRTKRKDGPEFDEHHLKLESDLDSVVVVSATAVDMGGRTADLMSIYVRHFVDTGCSKKELRDVAAENGITSSGTFTRALSTLVSSGALLNTGSDQRPFYKSGAVA